MKQSKTQKQVTRCSKAFNRYQRVSHLVQNLYGQTAYMDGRDLDMKRAEAETKLQEAKTLLNTLMQEKGKLQKISPECFEHWHHKIVSKRDRQQLKKLREEFKKGGAK